MSTVNHCQWHLLRADKWLLLSLTILPILLALSIGWIFSQSIVRELPIGVVDLQQSVLSRKLIRHFDASASLKVAQVGSDIAMFKKDFIGNKIYAYAIIPQHFDRDIALGKTPQVTTFYNSQFILVGKIINKAMVQAHGDFNAQVGTAKQLSKGGATALSAFGETVAVRTQIIPLFNKNSNYAQFLVSGIVPALWQIMVVLSTVLFLSANDRIYGLKKMLSSRPLTSLFSMSVFYLPFFLVQGFAFLICFYYLLEWPFFGSLLTLFFVQVITTLASMIMGTLFFCLAFDPTRAMSLVGVYTAPSFAFMGVTFPVSDMPLPAQVWRSLLPASHYIEAQISQVSYGASSWVTISQFMPAMFAYLVPLLLIVLLIKKHVRME